MRRYLYAGAVAGGFLLLGAAPAHADVEPAPAGAQQDAGALGGLLGSTGGLNPAGGLRVNDPLGGSGSLADAQPGDNSADVPGATDNLLPAQDGVPAARTGLGQAAGRTGQRPARRAGTEDLPVAGGGLPTGALGGLPVSNLPISNLPVSNLLGGLLPNGQSAGLGRGDQESGLVGNDLPLIGALLPGGGNTATPAVPAASGLPAGGTDVPAQDQPAKTKPAAVKPAADPAIANDARLHEEPTDPEGKGDKRRAFSDGRPVAGVDPDYR